jgi:hypothetical protein
MELRYHSEEFSPAWGTNLHNGGGSLSLYWPDLVKAATTVGKPGAGHMTIHGWHSRSDTISRTWMVYSCLRQSLLRFRKSSLYRDQDPTEKGGTSYFLGMMGAQLAGEHLLDVPWLMHLSMFRKLHGEPRLRSKSEPDLVGRRKNGDWIVLEAKGRTGSYSSDAMSKAKQQTRQLRSLNGQLPVLRAGVQTYFAPDLEMRIVDPDEIDEDAEDFEGDFNLAAGRYYSSVLSFLDDNDGKRELFGREYLVKTINEIGVTLGIERKVRELVQEGEDFEGNLLQYRQNLEFGESVTELEMERAYSDGFYVALDDRWSPERMMAEPNSRRRLT